MTRSEAVNLIRNSGGLIVGVEFRKRTDGTLRQGSFRTGVARVKGDLGSGRAYDPAAHGLLLVWDMQKQGYRSIPTEGITRVAFKGQWHNVTEDNPV